MNIFKNSKRKKVPVVQGPLPLISSEELALVNGAVEVLRNVLKPKLIALTEKDRQSLPKIGEVSKSFVVKVVEEHMDSHPEFITGFTDKDEVQQTWEDIKELDGIFREVDQIRTGLDDTIIQKGALVMRACSGFYQSTKMASKSRVPGAKRINEDLKVRFLKRRKKGGQDLAG